MALYVVAMTVNPGIGPLDVQSELDRAHGWYRYDFTSWIVCSHEPAATWTERLSRFIKPNGSMFVCRLNPLDSQGLMTQDFWRWFNSHTRS